MLLGIACEIIAHPHDLHHKMSTRKLYLPIMPRATTKPMHFFQFKKNHIPGLVTNLF